ncbi:MAG TPA: TetR/AcrR family transcriptional regulator [Methylomirabilota bacterium]|nr:TetR/AcrR family transcriptional regulator [Candidatus Acidoferrum sp.]HYT43504.1 TetR/AcrR family transcriptional regulator [Methylomirabilota bacterium]
MTSEYKTEVKERIIQSAVECFSKYGLDRTRMDDVAQKADLSKGTLYLYFKSKEDLFYVICENNLRVLKEQLSHIFATTKEDLVSNAEQFYENFHKEEKRESEKVFCEIIAESARNPKLQKILYTQRIKTFNVVREYLDRQMEKGFFKKDTDTEAIASGFVALYDGLIANEFLGVSVNHSKRSWRKTVRAIIMGIS